MLDATAECTRLLAQPRALTGFEGDDKALTFEVVEKAAAAL